MQLSPRLLSRSLAAWTVALVVVSAALAVAALGPSAVAGGVAHESEPRSLVATALFPAHVLREIPHLLVLALAFLAVAAPPRDAADAGARIRALLALFLTATVVLFAAAAAEEGARAATLDLAQARGAPDLVAPGVHVRLHLASDVALAALFAAAGSLIGGGATATRHAARLPLALAGAMLVAMALSAGFEGVASPRFVGHAARELQTHAAMTLPALLAAALARPAARLDLRAARGAFFLGAATCALVAGAWLAWRMRDVSLALHSTARDRPWWLNLAVHHWEHLADVALLLGAAAVWRRAGERAPEAA